MRQKNKNSKTESAFQTEEFKALQAEWTQKLKDSGFKDLEANAKETDRTSHVMLPGFNKASAVRGQAVKKQQFINLWASWFWHGEGNETEKLIADYMRQGFSFRELVKVLNDLKIKPPGNQRRWILSLTHPYVKELYESKVLPFNYSHPMGESSVNTDMLIDDVMIKEPSPYKD